ncbi:MAG: site-2 protease family protein [Candidatus Methylacidiphilaceae bacterium]
MKALLSFLVLAKFGKILLMAGTMLLSVLTYGVVFGWPYAVGFVALLFAHEMGHYIAARRRGLAVGIPIFIPFVGASIALKELPRNAETEAYVGAAGPFVGTAAALGSYILGRLTGNPLFLALAYAGFFLNLFNLIPLSPFDGGRICAIIDPRLWFLGVPILVVLFVLRPNPLLVLMAILAIPQLIRAWRHDRADASTAAYYSATGAEKVQYAVAYLGLAAFLAAMLEQIHAMLSGVAAAA